MNPVVKAVGRSPVPRLVQKLKLHCSRQELEKSTNEDKEAYRALLTTYRRSDQYLEYQAYIVSRSRSAVRVETDFVVRLQLDFKAKQATNDDSPRPPTSTDYSASPAKRPRPSKRPADLLPSTNLAFHESVWEAGISSASPPTHLPPFLSLPGSAVDGETRAGLPGRSQSFSGASSVGSLESVVHGLESI